MARIRTIKPEFWRHEGLSALPESTHMLAAALLNYADDDGYFNANPKLIQSECFPLREPSVSIHDSLSHLAEQGFLRLGSGPDGRRYGHIIHFLNHQHINRKTESKIKVLSIEWDDSRITHGELSEPSRLEGKGKEQGNGREGKEAHEAVRAEVLPPELIPDPRKAIFDDGLRWLSASTNKPRDKLRPLMARWIKARGDPEVAAAIIAAQQAGPVEPISWIEARLKSNERARPSDLQRRRARAEGFLSVGIGGDGENPPPPGETIDGVSERAS